MSRAIRPKLYVPLLVGSIDPVLNIFSLLVQFGSLLAWDLLFEYFEDAVSVRSANLYRSLLTPCAFTSQSLKLKTSYIEQLRNHDLVTASLLPSVFSILGVSGSRNRPFELAPWAVDEFMLERKSTCVQSS